MHKTEDEKEKDGWYRAKKSRVDELEIRMKITRVAGECGKELKSLRIVL